MRKGDIWLVGILLAVALAFIIPKWMSEDKLDDGLLKTATVTVDGEVLETIELGQQLQQFRIETRHGLNLIEVKDESIRMLEADCPDKLCVWSGAISQVNETIVCLPHRLIVEIVQHAGEGVEIDAIVR